MKILYLSSSTIPSQRANSIQVMKMCNAFSKLGNSVTVFAKSEKNDLPQNTDFIKEYYGIKQSFPVYNIQTDNIRFFGGIEYGYKVYKKIKELNFEPDLFYGRNLYALIACLKFNKPIIYESHVAPALGRKTLEYYLFSKPQFEKLVVISKALFDYYKSNFDILKKFPEKLILATDGADIYDEASSAQNNYCLNLKKRKPLVGYAGSLYPGKGVEIIIELAKAMPEINFVIAGGTKAQINHFSNKFKLNITSTTNYEMTLFPEMSLRASNRGVAIQNSFIFNCNVNNLTFKGFIQPSETPSFLSECDILLAPYSNEVYSEKQRVINLAKWMSPLKIFEYMASKRPIIASDLPSIKEILTDKKTALLIDYNNISEWKNSIIQLLCNPKLAKFLANNSFELLKNNYTWDIRAQNVLKGLNHKFTQNLFIESSLRASERGVAIHKTLKFNSHLDYESTISKNKPVILHIIGDLNVGGAEKNMLKIIYELNNKNFKHKIVTLFDYGLLAKDFKKAGIEVENIGISKNVFSISSLTKIIKLINRIKSINPAIIHTWLYHSNNIINLLSPFLKNILIINSIRHGNPSDGSIKTKISARIGGYISRFLKNPTIYCSKESLNNHTNIGYSESNNYIIPNGFAISNINKNTAKSKLRQILSIPQNYKIAIIVGRYSKEKDYPTLLKAIRIVLSNYSKIIFIFCGKNLDSANKELINTINHLQINNNIKLLGNQSNIKELMAGADFLVSSSNSEAFPNVIAEAMSLGTPCIATDAGETAKIIRDTGFIVPKKSPQILANAIIEFINLDERAKKTLSFKALKRIKTHFSLEKCVNQYASLYKSINSCG